MRERVGDAEASDGAGEEAFSESEHSVRAAEDDGERGGGAADGAEQHAVDRLALHDPADADDRDDWPQLVDHAYPSRRREATRRCPSSAVPRAGACTADPCIGRLAR